MTLNRRTLAEWVGRRTLQPPVATTFRLFHEGRHGLNQVCELPLEGGAEDWPDHIARLVHDESQTHASAYPGRQQYMVRAYADGIDQPIGEYPFGLTAGDEGSAATLSLQTPDYNTAMTGQIPLQDFSHPHAMVMAQQMRHNEGILRSLVDVTMHSRDRDGAIIKRQQEHIDHLEADRMKVLEMAEELMSRKQERQIVQEKWDSEKRRKDQIMAKLITFVLPEFAKRAGVAGVKAAPSNGEADKELDEIKRMFLKLAPETQNQIVAELPEDDSDRLLTIFEGGGGGDK